MKRVGYTLTAGLLGLALFAGRAEVALTAGEHDLALALGADQGKAWGAFLRLQRTDLGDATTPVLPEIAL